MNLLLSTHRTYVERTALFCALTLLPAALTFSQVTDRFYPLGIGDSWEYIDYGWMGVAYDTMSTTVLRDTVILGSSYRILCTRITTSTSTYYHYRRVDVRGDVVQFDPTSGSETLLYRFSDTSRSIWRQGTFYARFDTVAVSSVFSQARKCLRIFNYSPSDSTGSRIISSETLAEGIGSISGYGAGDGGSSRLRGARISGIVYGIITSGVSNPSTQSADFTLSQNYPNPFNPSTTISFFVPKASWVELRILNELGQQVELLVNRQCQPGPHSVAWTPHNLSSGVYFCQLHSSQGTICRKLVLIR
jgi:hypothetical protein